MKGTCRWRRSRGRCWRGTGAHRRRRYGGQSLSCGDPAGCKVRPPPPAKQPAGGWSGPDKPPPHLQSHGWTDGHMERWGGREGWESLESGGIPEGGGRSKGRPRGRVLTSTMRSEWYVERLTIWSMGYPRGHPPGLPNCGYGLNTVPRALLGVTGEKRSCPKKTIMRWLKVGKEETVPKIRRAVQKTWGVIQPKSFSRLSRYPPPPNQRRCIGAGSM